MANAPPPSNKRSVHLTAVPLPCEFRHETFGRLFRRQLKQGAICLGIYRKRRDHRGNAAPYVYTNPPSRLILEVTLLTRHSVGVWMLF